MTDDDVLNTIESRIIDNLLKAQACYASDDPRYWKSCVRYCHIACIHIVNGLLYVQDVVVANPPSLWEYLDFIVTLPINVDLSSIAWMGELAAYFEEYFKNEEDYPLYKSELETLLNILCYYMGIEKLNKDNYRKPFYITLGGGLNCKSSTYIIERSV